MHIRFKSALERKAPHFLVASQRRLKQDLENENPQTALAAN